ncbi:hypothetical protein [Mesorhizobium sp. M1B.F.Ca.ET.045.04.1.1]|uniref:hypothetical protein n=1 Tax=Mesorhizobium sp. M1B.F.Ca.ET.045.04.1.1 TaxID=2493673 RepID=UPI000F75B3CF|nr:hypothetical protein [Mesorhizobium sp. M1B.F.Ca.ET.045.04.1.1]AZO29800.1 hypothetical protein EJ071_21955 [Mesorhizobium sp. M1B.F.Ca.ET.045.04.1.1]
MMNAESPIPPHRHVVSLRDVRDLGYITEEMAALAACKSGPVRLLEGFQAPNGKGFGLLHIEANIPRGRQLEGLGFNSAVEFVAYIAANFVMVATQENGRLLLLAQCKNDWLHLVVEWDPEGFWSCTTAIPKRHARGITAVWTK